MQALEGIHYVKDTVDIVKKITTLAAAIRYNKRSMVYLRKTIVAL